MITSSRFRTLALGFSLALIFASVRAQSAPAKDAPGSAATQTTANPATFTTEQIATCTVRECWELSGKNEKTFFDIVGRLAVMSAQKRGLTLPDDAEAGRKAGEYIKARAKADPDQLLYAVVDEGVRKVGN